MSQEVSFFLNGIKVTVADPPPDLMLLDYVRSPEVGLIGPKKGCGEGGCGACTVILSHWDAQEERIENRAINACLRPVAALDGLVVTTIEGTGSVVRPPHEHANHALVFGRSAAPVDAPVPPALRDARRTLRHERARRKQVADASRSGSAMKRASASEGTEGTVDEHPAMNPVAHALALNNGSQCGYCSVGFVMNMTGFLLNNPEATKVEIEEALDGNLCRCTGYRAILTGMKTFASDWSEQDEATRMKCVEDANSAHQGVQPLTVSFPIEAAAPPRAVELRGPRQSWLTPTSLTELAELMNELRERNTRLVHGHTSYGVYKPEFASVDVFIDIRLVEDLAGVRFTDGILTVGAGESYGTLIRVLESTMADSGQRDSSPLGAARFMARRTAGRIVRNAASIGGNLMLVLHHVKGDEDPFPSDLATALVAIDAEVEWMRASDGETRIDSVGDLVDQVVGGRVPPREVILIRFHLPVGAEEEIALSQKVALRDVNAHSIVNCATRLGVGADLAVQDARVVFGGLAPFPWRAMRTEEALAARPLSLDEMPRLVKILDEEVREIQAKYAERMSHAVDEGFTDEYRRELSVSFLYKAVIHALNEVDESAVPPPLRSSGRITWGRWGESTGRQYFATRGFESPLAQPLIKLMAMYQASGQVHYTHEKPVPVGTLNGAFVQSGRALADYRYVLPGGAAPVSVQEVRAHLSERFPTFAGLITHAELPPGGVNHQGMGGDQPIFAEQRITYAGQVIAMALAETDADAVEIAEYVQRHCVLYEPVDWGGGWGPEWRKPVLGIEDAIRRRSIFPDFPASMPFLSHIWRIERQRSRMDWVDESRDPLASGHKERGVVIDGVPCTVVEAPQRVGGQIHFYFETQACIAEPVDQHRMVVSPSAQSPMGIHAAVSKALGHEYNRIEVRVGPVGGAYGGKTEQARFPAAATAVAAHAMARPVRLAMEREADSHMIGKRHPYFGQYQIAIDRGEVRDTDKGRILGLHTKMWGDGGAFYDCSFVVSDCIQLRVDGAYYVPNFRNEIEVCRTNTAPNTAMRSFGELQSQIIIENAIDDAAFAVGMRGEEARDVSLYQKGETTPFGQALTYCYMREVWEYLKEVCGYESKLEAVRAFNDANKWRKRGLAMIPVKYGSGYNLTQLERSGALIAVFGGDGTIIVHQGGVDMGQGLRTKVEQIAAYVLNVPMDFVHIGETSTSVVPNPISTGGSTGTAYNGTAVRGAAAQLRSRLEAFAKSMLTEHGEAWCRDKGIDYWNYGVDGWRSVPECSNEDGEIIWQKLVKLALANRVDLVSSYNAQIPGGTEPMSVLQYKTLQDQEPLPGIPLAHEPSPGGSDQFVGFTYSAACSVVEVDILTGETKILSSDIVYDIGWSLNPAIDVGQVEGAFIQGVGCLLTERLVYETEGDDQGRLNTPNTWRYKPPAASTIPLELNVHLFPRDRADKVSPNPNELFSAKEVGEPPVVLANTVFSAIKDAVRASRVERNLPGLFRMDSPATVDEVRRACEVRHEELAGV